MDKMIVQLIFAQTSTSLWQQSIRLNEGATIQDALQASDIYAQFDRAFIASLGISIFGKKASLTTPLQMGDRIELCRHLSFDPKESRKRRAQHRKVGILKKKHLKPDRAKKIAVDVHTH